MTLGLILSNLGGPRDLDEVEPFLRDLFSDPDIFPLPGGPRGQQAFASLIARRRAPRVSKTYAALGGKSPLYALTLAQQEGLVAALAARGFAVEAAIGMRYGRPSQGQATRELLSRGCDRLMVVPLYPHYSIASTGSTINEQGRVMRALGADTVPWDFLPPFPLDPGYLHAFAATIARGLHEWEAAGLSSSMVLMFTAHGLPKSFIDRGDVYKRQITASVRALVRLLDYQDRWALTFQSRVGPIEWLKPYTDKSIIQWSEEGVEGIIAVPISFVADNLETSYEMAVEYHDLARACGIESFLTIPCLNADPAFIDALAELVARRIARPGPSPPPTMYLPGKRPRTQLIGARELGYAARHGRPYAPESVRVQGPWKESQR